MECVKCDSCTKGPCLMIVPLVDSGWRECSQNTLSGKTNWHKAYPDDVLDILKQINI